MVSHDLPHSTVARQIAFDQRDSNSSPKFECPMDCPCQALVSKFTLLIILLLMNIGAALHSFEAELMGKETLVLHLHICLLRTLPALVGIDL